MRAHATLGRCATVRVAEDAGDVVLKVHTAPLVLLLRRYVLPGSTVSVMALLQLADLAMLDSFVLLVADMMPDRTIAFLALALVSEIFIARSGLLRQLSAHRESLEAANLILVGQIEIFQTAPHVGLDFIVVTERMNLLRALLDFFVRVARKIIPIFCVPLGTSVLREALLIILVQLGNIKIKRVAGPVKYAKLDFIVLAMWISVRLMAISFVQWDLCVQPARQFQFRVLSVLLEMQRD
jgi:hypothetical protein